MVGSPPVAHFDLAQVGQGRVASGEAWAAAGHETGKNFPVPSASPETGFLREIIHAEQLTRDEGGSFNSEGLKPAVGGIFIEPWSARHG